MTKQCINCKYCKKTYIGSKEWYLFCKISNEQVNNNSFCNKFEDNELYKKCKHNTSSGKFVGYCDLYLNEDNSAGRLVECKKCPCDDFEL